MATFGSPSAGMRNPGNMLAFFQPAPASVSAFNTFTTAGALVAQSATIAGAATHLTLHITSGALAAGSATVSGTAAHQHIPIGALAAQNASIAGSASRASVVLHPTTGSLAANAAQISGAADHISNAASLSFDTFLPRKSKKKQPPSYQKREDIRPELERLAAEIANADKPKAPIEAKPSILSSPVITRTVIARENAAKSVAEIKPEYDDDEDVVVALILGQEQEFRSKMQEAVKAVFQQIKRR